MVNWRNEGGKGAVGGGRGTISGAPSLLSFSLLEFVFAQQSGGLGKGKGEDASGRGMRRREGKGKEMPTEHDERNQPHGGGGEIRSMRTVLEGAD